jgi:hypothetical protein
MTKPIAILLLAIALAGCANRPTVQQVAEERCLGLDLPNRPSWWGACIALASAIERDKRIEAASRWQVVQPSYVYVPPMPVQPQRVQPQPSGPTYHYGADGKVTTCYSYSNSQFEYCY